MSTDIVHWDKDQRTYQAGALRVYLVVCVPFMAATFMIWAVLQWRERRKERLQNERVRASLV